MKHQIAGNVTVGKTYNYGYWVHEDGFSHWGDNLLRYTKSGWTVGLPIDENRHKMNSEDKAKYWADEMVKINEAKAKAAEEAAKKGNK